MPAPHRRKVVWNSFAGRYSDSPRALFEALRPRAEEFEHVWLARPDRLADFPADARTVTYTGAGPEVRAELESADVIVSNDGLSWEWDKDPATTYLQTWHGTPLKRLHRDTVWKPEGRMGLVMKDIPRWDHLLSPNAASTPHFRSAFGFTGPVHETGYPRNDVLSSPGAARRRAEVRAALGLADGATVVLWAPTWRDDLVLATDRSGLDLPVEPAELAAAMGPDHVLLVRLHAMVAERLVLPAGAPVQDVSRYPDISDLYLAADVLLTDYSSTMFDFAVTGRPIVHFTYDLAHYRDDVRGFYFDLADIAPGPLHRTAEEVLAAIAALSAGHPQDQQRYACFRETFCGLEDGHATDRVLARFFPAG